MKILQSSYIAEIIAPYGFVIDQDRCEAIRSYIDLLLLWNRRVSLTRVLEPEEILRFHFGESLFAINQVPIHEGRLADVGSGAGFPGLALKIALPELRPVLIESNVKKAAFLSEVRRELALKNVEVYRGRMESMPSEVEAFEFITARALGNYPDLLKWASRHLTVDGKLILWLGDAEAANLAEADAWNWRKPVHMPGSERRFLLIGTPRN